MKNQSTNLARDAVILSLTIALTLCGMYFVMTAVFHVSVTMSLILLVPTLLLTVSALVAGLQLRRERQVAAKDTDVRAGNRIAVALKLLLACVLAVAFTVEGIVYLAYERNWFMAFLLFGLGVVAAVYLSRVSKRAVRVFGLMPKSHSTR